MERGERTMEREKGREREGERGREGGREGEREGDREGVVLALASFNSSSRVSSSNCRADGGQKSRQKSGYHDRLGFSRAEGLTP
jgi:hypothetical protein